MTSRPHDALFRSAFEHPADAAALLRHLLPPALTAAVDWSALRPEPGSFIDPELADRESDLLFSTSIADERVLLYLLLEHQSEIDRRMPLRMLVYITRIWERHGRDHLDSALPAVIPVLVSHARGGWRAPTSLHELVVPPPATVPGLAELVPGFRIVLDDLEHTSNEELRARALAHFPMLALWLLRDARTPRALLQNLDAWAQALHETASAASGLHALAKLLRYVALVLPDVIFEEFRDKLIELAPSTHEAAMNYHEKVIEEGRAEGERRALLKLLAAKFGAIDPSVKQRVETAAAEQIERWLERILVADRIEAVLDA